MRITFQDVFYTYNITGPALPSAHIDGVSFSVDSRETIGLVGANGAGKTTLLQLITGLEKPDRGQITVDGADIHGPDYELSALRSRIGLVFQSPEFQLFEPTVSEDIAFGPRNLGWAEERVHRLVSSALQAVGLDAAIFAGKSIYELSEGEKRRVAIAGILAMEPAFMLFDEPTAGLDDSGRQHITAILHGQKAAGKGYIVASHDMELLLETVSRFIVLENGRLLADFPTGEFAQYCEKLPHILEPTRCMRLVSLLRDKGIPIPDTVRTRDALLDFLDDLTPQKK